MQRAYGDVVEGGQEEEYAKERNGGQEDGRQRRAPAGGAVDLAAAVATKGRQRHEDATDNICGPERHELAVRAEHDVLDAVGRSRS